MLIVNTIIRSSSLSIKRTAYGSMVTAGCCLRNVIDARQCVLKSATISVRHSDMYLEMQVRMEANKSKQYRDPPTKSLNYLSHKNHCLDHKKGYDVVGISSFFHFMRDSKQINQSHQRD